ncbi:QueG-associated DUF1730 domain-containing protein, partial [Stieleria sp.]|uniref:QueG-associated DUF1730 domain-containing protein n=1 Tax=Stieleria sp. TaxID=2795976 RepID=UPI00356674AF
MNESPPDPAGWLPLFRQRAAELGFINAGIAPAVDSAGFTDLVKWIESGCAAGMQYFADRLDAYRHADGVMAGTKSIIVLAYPYPADADQPCADGQGSVARYAWPGADYHDTIHAKLKQLQRLVAELAPNISTRGCIDTAP